MTSCFLRAGLRSISRLRPMVDLPKIAIEAGIRQGWSPLLNREDGFVGMDGFGASGPGGELFEHFGITAQVIVSKAKEMLGR